MQNFLKCRPTYSWACVSIYLCFYKKGNTVQWWIWEFWYSFHCNLGCDEACVWSQQAKIKCHLHSQSSTKVSVLVLALQTTESFAIVAHYCCSLLFTVVHYSNICVQPHKQSASAVASSLHLKKHASNHSPASHSKAVKAIVSLGQKVPLFLPLPPG